MTKKLSEYELRKELIVQLRQILEFETALLSTQEDDIQCFIVKKPENISDYSKELEKWKRNQGLPDNRPILFIYNPEEKENHWESWFWIPEKIKEFFMLNICEKSILSVFLKHIYYKKSTNLFSGELLDMLADKDVFLNIDQNFKNIPFF